MSPGRRLQLPPHLPPAAAKPDWTVSCSESPRLPGERPGRAAAGQSALAQSLARSNVQPLLCGGLFAKHWCCVMGEMSCPGENPGLAAS